MRFSSKNSTKSDRFLCTADEKQTLTCYEIPEEEFLAEKSRGSSSSREPLSPRPECSDEPKPNQVPKKNDWPAFGRDLGNTRHAEDERTLNPENAASIHLKWRFSSFTDSNGNTRVVGDITCTPTVYENRLYFGDYAQGAEDGKVYCLNKKTGKLIWWKEIRQAINYSKAGIFIRASPAVTPDGKHIIIGTQRAPANALGDPFPAAFLVKMCAMTGKVIWVVAPPVDPLQPPNLPPTGSQKFIEVGSEYIFTGSPVVYREKIYVGLASQSEAYSLVPNFIYGFRGRMMFYDLKTGKQIWQTYTITDDIYLRYNEEEQPRTLQRYTGNAIWSAPCIDVKRNRIYGSTGNNYTAPASRLELFAEGLIKMPEPGNYCDAVITFCMDTGKIIYSLSTLDNKSDVWTLACLRGIDDPECNEGPDADIGAAPILFKTRTNKDIVAVGVKSSEILVFDPDTTEILSDFLTIPDEDVGTIGGIQWGAAAAGGLFYAQASVSTGARYHQNTDPLYNGAMMAVDPVNGRFVWRLANPVPDQYSGGIISNFGATPGGGSVMAYNAPPSIGDGIVFFPVSDNTGSLFIIDAETSVVLKVLNTGATNYGGGCISDGMFYLGNGYRRFNGTAGTGMSAYGI